MVMLPKFAFRSLPGGRFDRRKNHGPVWSLWVALAHDRSRKVPVSLRVGECVRNGERGWGVAPSRKPVRSSVKPGDFEWATRKVSRKEA